MSDITKGRHPAQELLGRQSAEITRLRSKIADLEAHLDICQSASSDMEYWCERAQKLEKQNASLSEDLAEAQGMRDLALAANKELTGGDWVEISHHELAQANTRAQAAEHGLAQAREALGKAAGYLKATHEAVARIVDGASADLIRSWEAEIRTVLALENHNDDA